LTSKGSRKSLYELYEQSTPLVYHGIKLLCVKIMLVYSFKFLMCVQLVHQEQILCRGIGTLEWFFDGLFGLFLKRVKTTFVPRRPRSRLSDRYAVPTLGQNRLIFNFNEVFVFKFLKKLAL
jgi:hypothetical protein